MIEINHPIKKSSLKETEDGRAVRWSLKKYLKRFSVNPKSKPEPQEEDFVRHFCLLTLISEKPDETLAAEENALFTKLFSPPHIISQKDRIGFIKDEPKIRDYFIGADGVGMLAETAAEPNKQKSDNKKTNLKWTFLPSFPDKTTAEFICSVFDTKTAPMGVKSDGGEFMVTMANWLLQKSMTKPKFDARTNEIKEEAIQSLQQKAVQAGANALVGVHLETDYDYVPLPSGMREQILIIVHAQGTAVKISSEPDEEIESTAQEEAEGAL